MGGIVHCVPSRLYAQSRLLRYMDDAIFVYRIWLLHRELECNLWKRVTGTLKNRTLGVSVWYELRNPRNVDGANGHR